MILEPPPPFVMSEHALKDGRVLHVVRDDALPGGTKQRVAFDYLCRSVEKRCHEQNLSTTTVLYTGPCNAIGCVPVAEAAKKLGLACTVILSREVFGDEALCPNVAAMLIARTIDAIDKLRYAKVQVLVVDTWQALNHIGTSLAADKNVFWIPSGFNDSLFVDLLAESLMQSRRLSSHHSLPDPRCIWVVSGTGTMAQAIARAFPNTDISIVPVGEKSIPRLEAMKNRMMMTGKDTRKIEIYEAIKKKDEDEDEDEEHAPYPTMCLFDSLVWRVARLYAKNGDIIWNTAS